MRDVWAHYTVVCCCPPILCHSAWAWVLHVQRLKTDGKDALRLRRLVCTDGEGLVLCLCVYFQAGGASSLTGCLEMNFKGFSLYSGNFSRVLLYPVLGGLAGKKGLSWIPNSHWFFFLSGAGLALISGFWSYTYKSELKFPFGVLLALFLKGTSCNLLKW